ncbi:unnamed protein product [Parnassius apollo]|uniref:(apollo) hypothetical protein n=1 Tax=Parnassius apollo TaxID=110799 RepID=A0A8S3WKX5_PARAO|nr:unnamed protein product [Parnassius apollo]
MKSKNDAIEILRNKTKLDKPSNIKSDQTAMQREYLKYLRDELKNRTNNGEQDQYTRFRQGHQPSTLDLILTNDESLIVGINYEAAIGKSDHACLVSTIQLQTQQNRQQSKSKKNFNKGDYNKIKEEIHSGLKKMFKDVLCPVEQFRIMHKTITNAIDTHVPLVKTFNNVNKPWIKYDLSALIREKKIIWKRYTVTGSDKIYKEHRKLNNKLTNLRRTARAVYENQLLDLGPKKFYSYIRQQITSKVSTPNILRKSNGQSVTRSKDIAEVFAEHFSNVFEREPLEELPALDPNLRATEVMEDIMFTESKVQAAIKEMNIDSSPGPDEIPVQSNYSYLASVMQKSYDKGVLPYLWKTALVTPVYKKGNKLDPANYRPISLTSVVCKVMEKIIVKHMRQFLKKQQTIGKQQHGFCPHRSTISSLMSCLSSWVNSQNDREPIDVIYLDYEKAFDKVPIGRLLHKLESNKKNSEKWIKCWQDWRSDVKAKAAKIHCAQQQTGGGPGPAPLSATEESLMAFIGHEAAEGLTVADTLEVLQIHI